LRKALRKKKMFYNMLLMKESWRERFEMEELRNEKIKLVTYCKQPVAVGN